LLLRKTTKMDLTALAAFVRVVQAGSFTRAAESMDTQVAARPVRRMT
jgi:DNA-binding transcriptional LysR family regulator